MLAVKESSCFWVTSDTCCLTKSDKLSFFPCNWGGFSQNRKSPGLYTSTKWLVVGNRVRAAKTAAAAAAAVNKKLIGRMPRKAFFISLCTFEIYSLQWPLKKCPRGKKKGEKSRVIESDRCNEASRLQNAAKKPRVVTSRFRNRRSSDLMTNYFCHKKGGGKSL